MPQLPIHTYLTHPHYLPQHHPLVNIPVPPSILKKTSIYTQMSSVSILKEQNSKLKSLSATRWSSIADASKDLIENFDGIFNALSEIISDKDKKSDTRHEAESFKKKND